MQVGDLVQEVLPLMAGDAPSRVGLLVQAPTPIGKGFVRVLFDREEIVHYNTLRKVEG